MPYIPATPPPFGLNMPEKYLLRKDLPIKVIAEIQEQKKRKTNSFTDFVASNARSVHPFDDFMTENFFGPEDKISAREFEQKIKFEASGTYSMLLRDILFYLTGFVFGFKNRSAQQCIKFYLALRAENA